MPGGRLRACGRVPSLTLRRRWWRGWSWRHGFSKLIGFGMLPIAGAGVVLFFGTLGAMVRRTRLVLDRTSGTLETRPFGRKRALHTRELRATETSRGAHFDAFRAKILGRLQRLLHRPAE